MAPAPQEEGYRIHFDGQVVDGFSREAVMLTASARLKFTDAQRDRLFSGQEVVMKRGLSEDKARHYLDTLRKLGMNARVEPPLPAPAPNPMLDAAEASLVETQLAQQSAYNFEETFHSSSTLEMAQEAMAADDIHPALRAAVAPPAAAPSDPSTHVATVINDDIVRAYADELAEAAPDPAVEALRAAHDAIPATPAPPSSPPPPEPDIAPVAAVAEDPRAGAPEDADEMPAEADAPPAAAGGATRTLAVVLGVVVVAALIAWWLA
ncbi:hypothetical protein G3580_18470 [Nitrogeniibacter mangrovi]|uniref:Uncharacterized protein n=1 Tax=Nitrogeniibacter mangrovi TaxID=2016596 RepID=A0A6C1B6Q3_9RHOO|nr:hypothetical protein [Nitrogeniibacter mangrovi]QID19426.1 hypothetical protein G3580_18470 [Nitrogeniibacter mangrovi]